MRPNSSRVRAYIRDRRPRQGDVGREREIPDRALGEVDADDGRPLVA